MNWNNEGYNIRQYDDFSGGENLLEQANYPEKEIQFYSWINEIPSEINFTVAIWRKKKPTMRQMRIHDEHDRLIKTIEIPKAKEYSIEQIEAAFGRKLKAGEQVVMNWETNQKR